MKFKAMPTNTNNHARRQLVNDENVSCQVCYVMQGTGILWLLPL